MSDELELDLELDEPGLAGLFRYVLNHAGVDEIGMVSGWQMHNGKDGYLLSLKVFRAWGPGTVEFEGADERTCFRAAAEWLYRRERR